MFKYFNIWFYRLTENYYFFKLLRYVKQQRLVKAWIVWAFEQNVLTESWFIEWIVFDGRWMRYTGNMAKLGIIFADCSDEISNGDWTGMRTDIVFDTLFRSVETKIGHGKSDTMDLWKLIVNICLPITLWTHVSCHLVQHMNVQFY